MNTASSMTAREPAGALVAATRRPTAARRSGQASATVLLMTAVALWFHEWLPAVLAATCVGWVLFHRRLEGPLGAVLLRWWRRAWPPGALALAPFFLAGTLVYWLSSVPLKVKFLPLALNLVALAVVVLDIKRTVVRTGGLVDES